MTSENTSSPDGMATELVAHRGQQPVREGVLTPRAEAREQRGGDGRGRNALLHRVVHRPAALAGILDPGLERAQLGIGGQRVGREVEQPRAHHAALHPELGDGRQVEPVLDSDISSKPSA